MRCQSAGRLAWREQQEEQDCPSCQQRWAALRMRLDSSLRCNDEDSPPVIPGAQRETRNPGAYHRGKGILFLSRSPLDFLFAGLRVRSGQALVTKQSRHFCCSLPRLLRSARKDTPWEGNRPSRTVLRSRERSGRFLVVESRAPRWGRPALTVRPLSAGQ